MKISQIKIGVILSYVIIVLNSIVGLVYTPILIRTLGQSEYGLYSLVSSVILYLTVFDLGFGNAITVYTSKYIARGETEKAQKLHGMFFIIYFVIAIVAFIAGLILYFNVDNMFANSLTAEELSKAKILMLMLSVNLMLTFSFSIFSSIINANERFIFAKCINILKIILQPILMLPLLLLGAKSITLVAVITLINIISILCNVIYCVKKLKVKFKFGKINIPLLKEIISYSIFVCLMSIVDKVNWSVDKLILGMFAGTTAVAIYAAAAQLNYLYLTFSTAISGVLLPRVSKMEANNASDEEFTNIFIKTGRIQYLLLALVITGFVFFGKAFIEIIWVGKDYTLSYYIACILMIPVTIDLIQNVGISILQAKNKFKYRTMILIGVAVLNILISIPLAKLYGGIGAAIGTCVSLLLGQGLLVNLYYWKGVGIDIPRFWKEILKMSIPMVFVVLIGIFLHKIWPISTVLDFLIQVVLYSLVYIFVVWNFSMNESEKDIIKKPLLKIESKFIKKK